MTKGLRVGIHAAMMITLASTIAQITRSTVPYVNSVRSDSSLSFVVFTIAQMAASAVAPIRRQRPILVLVFSCSFQKTMAGTTARKMSVKAEYAV